MISILLVYFIGRICCRITLSFYAIDVYEVDSMIMNQRTIRAGLGSTMLRVSRSGFEDKFRVRPLFDMCLWAYTSEQFLSKVLAVIAFPIVRAPIPNQVLSFTN